MRNNTGYDGDASRTGGSDDGDCGGVDALKPFVLLTSACHKPVMGDRVCRVEMLDIVPGLEPDVAAIPSGNWLLFPDVV